MDVKLRRKRNETAKEYLYRTCKNRTKEEGIKLLVFKYGISYTKATMIYKAWRREYMQIRGF